MNDKEFFLKQLKKINESYLKLLENARWKDLSACKKEEIEKLIVQSKAAVGRISGVNSDYYEAIERILKENVLKGLKLKAIIGVVTALTEDIENDYLKSVQELIHSDVFTDFLEMAKYLLNEGYKDAAAVIAGSTLEEHLRKLSLKNGIGIERRNTRGELVPLKADSINSNLAGAANPVYSKGIQKQITAWLDIRNNAAHGHYDKYTQEEVNLMIMGIMNFIASNAA